MSIHLSEKTGFDVVLKPEDYICFTCYKVHLVTLKTSEDKTNSPDSILRSTIENWRVKCLEAGTDLVTRAVLTTVLFVADHISHQRAILLPQASRLFEDMYIASSGDGSTEQISLEVGDSSIQFSSRWLLHQLIMYLEPHMSYKQVHP